MSKTLRQELADEITEFLSNYGKKSQMEDYENEWSSPDASCLEDTAHALKSDLPLKLIAVPRSSWDSGGYGPYSSQEGKDKHNDLMKRIKKIKQQ